MRQLSIDNIQVAAPHLQSYKRAADHRVVQVHFVCNFQLLTSLRVRCADDVTLGCIRQVLGRVTQFHHACSSGVFPEKTLLALRARCLSRCNLGAVFRRLQSVMTPNGHCECHCECALVCMTLRKYLNSPRLVVGENRQIGF